MQTLTGQREVAGHRLSQSDFIGRGDLAVEAIRIRPLAQVTKLADLEAGVVERWEAWVITRGSRQDTAQCR